MSKPKLKYDKVTGKWFCFCPDTIIFGVGDTKEEAYQDYNLKKCLDDGPSMELWAHTLERWLKLYPNSSGLLEMVYLINRVRGLNIGGLNE